MLQCFLGDSLAQQLFFLFLFFNHLQIILCIVSLCILSFLVIFVVNLSVVLVLTASSAFLLLYSPFLNLAVLLGHQASVLAVQGILEL